MSMSSPPLARRVAAGSLWAMPTVRRALIPTVAATMLLAGTGCGGGCGGAPSQPSLIEEQQQRRAQAAEASSYEMREGLHIDIPYLAGRDWDSLDPEVVSQQLGTEVGRRDLGVWGIVEIDFGDKTVQLYDGKIHYISYRFADPMDLSTAMGVCGFPLRVPNRIDASNECRIIHHWGMRQISLIRVERDRDLYSEIRVWKFRPQELELRRDGEP